MDEDRRRSADPFVARLQERIDNVKENFDDFRSEVRKNFDEGRGQFQSMQEKLDQLMISRAEQRGKWKMLTSLSALSGAFGAFVSRHWPF